MKRICAAAAENKINVSLGFSERDGDSLYIAQALISEYGEIKMARRKMKPTHMERTIFGDATGGNSCLSKVVDLPEVGRVGGLSYWEHIQPLLKYYTFAQSEQIHVGAWPALDGFFQDSLGLYSMSIEGCRSVSQTYAMESQAFVLHCTTVISEGGIQQMGTAGSLIMGHPNQGSSCVIGPDGRTLSKTDNPNEELIIADLDLSLVTKAKTFIDVSGHYSRPDLMWLGVDEKHKPVVRGVESG